MAGDTIAAASRQKFLLGVQHQQAGRYEDATRCYRAVIAKSPGSAEAHYNLAVVLYYRGRLGDAIRSYHATLTLQPTDVATHVGIGVAYGRGGDFGRAEAHLRQAVTLDPRFARGHYLYGELMRSWGRLDEARNAFERALALDPGYASARFGRGMIRLLTGELPDGWSDYEYRPSQQTPLDPALAPRWRGENPSGRVVLLYAQQGIGDTLQFLRYVALVAGLGAKVALAVPITTMALAARLAGVHQLVEPNPRLPPFDWSCPLASLPFIFATTLATIPANLPYLSAPPERITTWQKRLAGAPRFTVAIAWAGNADHPNDHNRSLRFADIAPILGQPGIRYLLLQKGMAATDADTCKKLAAAGVSIEMLGAQLDDYADTAALVALADLVISVDTSLCHLAGALGRPVWTLLPYAPDWRWLLDRDDTPWYPTMRLYRQNKPGDWSGVVELVGQHLAACVAARRFAVNPMTCPACPAAPPAEPPG